MPPRAPRAVRVSLPLEAFVVALLALPAAPAAAETVQYTFTGTIGTVSDGTSGSLDLTKSFEVGQPATIVATVERSTPGFPLGDVTHYLDCVMEWSFAIGWYVRPSAAPYNPSSVFVGNDFDDPIWGLSDSYELWIPQPYGAAPVGSANLGHLLVRLFDAGGTALADESLPRLLPDAGKFGRAIFLLQFADESVLGSVEGELTSIATPATAPSWGRLKAAYRR